MLLAALINASKVIGRGLDEMTVVINGAGAAGTAISKLIKGVGVDPAIPPVKDVICDSKGAIATT